MFSDKSGARKVREAPICFAALSTVQSPSQENVFFPPAVSSFLCYFLDCVANLRELLTFAPLGLEKGF